MSEECDLVRVTKAYLALPMPARLSVARTLRRDNLQISRNIKNANLLWVHIDSVRESLGLRAAVCDAAQDPQQVVYVDENVEEDSHELRLWINKYHGRICTKLRDVLADKALAVCRAA